MSYRVLCDENVDPASVGALERYDIDAIHVTNRPGPSSSDDEVARTARTEDRVIVTNDNDFLDNAAFPAVSVLYYPENRLPPHDLAERVDAIASVIPDQSSLPPILFLTESNTDF